jgi:aldehyde:ferredoxin oxidoreductase
VRQVRPPGSVDERQGPGIPGLRRRGIQGIGLAYATSNRGACHLRGYTVASEVLGIPVKTDPLATEGKPELVKAFQDATGVFDSAGICVFTSFAWTLADVQPQIQAACEGDWSMEKLNLVGERIWNMERQFNLAAGLTAKDDDLPPRLKTEPGQDRSGQGAGQRRSSKMMPSTTRCVAGRRKACRRRQRWNGWASDFWHATKRGCASRFPAFPFGEHL